MGNNMKGTGPSATALNRIYIDFAILTLFAICVSAFAGMLTMRRGAGVLARLSALMLVVSLGVLGVLLAYPWWRYPSALHTVLLVRGLKTY